MCPSRCAPDSAVAARVLLTLRSGLGCRCACAPPAALRTPLQVAARVPPPRCAPGSAAGRCACAPPAAPRTPLRSLRVCSPRCSPGSAAGRCACAPPAALRTRLSLLGWGPPRSALSPATAESGAQREEHTRSDRSGARSAAGGAHAQRQPSPERSEVSTRAATAESGAQRDQHTRSDSRVRSAAGGAHAQRPQPSPERSGRGTRAATCSGVRSAAGGAHAQRPQPSPERSGRGTRAASSRVRSAAGGAHAQRQPSPGRSGITRSDQGPPEELAQRRTVKHLGVGSRAGGGVQHGRHVESRAQRTQRPANYPWAPGSMACVHAHTKSSS